MNGLRDFQQRCSAALVAILLSISGLVGAAPGAHGPGGEHLDATASSGAVQARPRMEASTELFELVAVLGGGELSILLDRFETNEPVTRAEVEIESGGVKANARFHADHGDFSVDDPIMMKLLSQPGEHPILVLVKAGSESDLLNGTLVVTADHADAEGHGHEREYVAFAAAALALVLLFGWLWPRRRRGAAASGRDDS